MNECYLTHFNIKVVLFYNPITFVCSIVKYILHFAILVEYMRYKYAITSMVVHRTGHMTLISNNKYITLNLNVWT